MSITRRNALALAVALALVTLPEGALASEPDRGFTPYDGSLPFRCELQQVGTGVKFKDPKADPFCVEYDKTNQNIAALGIVDFASQEPARFAVAGDKCFYFQHDHWTGSVVQGQQPELWHWDGSYWWDKARGVGAAYFGNARIAGYGDWSPVLPLLPPDFRRFAQPTGWGAVFYGNYPVDQRCAAMVDTPEEAARVYGEPPQATPRGDVEGERRASGHRRKRHASRRCTGRHGRKSCRHKARRHR